MTMSIKIECMPNNETERLAAIRATEAFRKEMAQALRDNGQPVHIMGIGPITEVGNVYIYRQVEPEKSLAGEEIQPWPNASALTVPARGTITLMTHVHFDHVLGQPSKLLKTTP